MTFQLNTKFVIIFASLEIFCHGIIIESIPNYLPNWDSLDSRPLPNWYDEAKIGVKINWGIFSTIGIDGPWFWHCLKEGTPECVTYMQRNFKPGTTYQDLIPEFSGEFFNASEWVELTKRSGAKCLIVTAKHHDGYTLFPSERSFSYNSFDSGPHRDVVGEIETAVSSQSRLNFGVYYSLLDWYNPFYMEDKENNFTTNLFIKNKLSHELQQLVNNYKPDIIWTDGDWDASDTYWNSTHFLSWLYNASPIKDTIVVNDRWGKGDWCRHGGFITCTDRYNPKVLQNRKWENCMSLHNDSWAFRVNAKVEEFITPKELIVTLAETAACGGNMLVNFRPTKEGSIQPLVQERLLQLGDWLGINGEAIYNTIPWKQQNDPLTKSVWYTASRNGSIIYAHLTYYQKVILGAMSTVSVKEARMLGYGETKLYIEQIEKGLQIYLPDKIHVKSNFVWRDKRCQTVEDSRDNQKFHGRGNAIIPIPGYQLHRIYPKYWNPQAYLYIRIRCPEYRDLYTYK